MYDPKSGIHLGDKLWTNQQFSALKIDKSINAKSGDILEKILEREGTLDVFSTETSSLFPIFSANNLDAVEKELQRSAQNHYNSKGHRYTIKLLKQASNNDIFGIQDEQSSSPEYTIMLPKYKAMTLFEFLDIYPLPTNYNRS